MVSSTAIVMYFMSQSQQESDINGILKEGRPYSRGEATSCAARLLALR